ncbi:hypothetical protein ACJX0J_032332, partial [Zea mays]
YAQVTKNITNFGSLFSLNKNIKLLQYIIFSLFPLLVIYDHYLVHSLILVLLSLVADLVSIEVVCFYYSSVKECTECFGQALMLDVIVNNISYVTLF